MPQLIFPYENLVSPIGGKIQQSIILVCLRFPETGKHVWEEMLVDTGADYTVCNAAVASSNNLDIDLSHAPEISLGVAAVDEKGKRISRTAKLSSVEICLVDDSGFLMQWNARVAFCIEPVARPLLGYVGFREFLQLSFDEDRKALIVEPAASFTGRLKEP